MGKKSFIPNFQSELTIPESPLSLNESVAFRSGAPESTRVSSDVLPG